MVNQVNAMATLTPLGVHRLEGRIYFRDGHRLV